MARCEKCGKETKDTFVTIYGEQRCDLCYDDYIMTDKGKVEYLVGLVSAGQLNIKDYDSDFLGHVAVCWKKYRDELCLTMKAIKIIEDKAHELGLL